MQNWFESDLGRYVLARELEWFDATSADLFGFNALQVGLCHEDFLRANRMPYRYCAAVGAGHFRCRPEFLPIDSQSMDLVALPHALEFSPNPHQLLREVERVLRPEGRLLLAGFNPLSLWGLTRVLGRKVAYPWHGQFLRLSRIKDWLSLLGFELAAGRMVCYAPPVNRQGWLDRSHFMEAAGDRWWALGGGVYLLHAVKRVHGMRLISPRWDEKWLAKPALARPTSRVVRQ
jgi:SAM-dependent methyltransferase